METQPAANRLHAGLGISPLSAPLGGAAGSRRPDDDSGLEFGTGHALIETRGLTLSSSGGHEVNVSDLALHKGEAAWICGASAAVRTGLLRTLCGLEQPLRGKVLWKGRIIHGIPQLLHSELALLDRRNAVKPELTPREHLQFHLRLHDACPRLDIAACLHKVGLTAMIDTRCRLLSAGQRRKVALARLLCMRATIWVLDEPLQSLDQTEAFVIEEMLANHLLGRGVAVFASEQPLSPPHGKVRAIDLGACTS